MTKFIKIQKEINESNSYDLYLVIDITTPIIGNIKVKQKLIGDLNKSTVDVVIEQVQKRIDHFISGKPNGTCSSCLFREGKRCSYLTAFIINNMYGEHPVTIPSRDFFCKNWQEFE
jgi:hypothetical protein